MWLKSNSGGMTHSRTERGSAPLLAWFSASLPWRWPVRETAVRGLEQPSWGFIRELARASVWAWMLLFPPKRLSLGMRIETLLRGFDFSPFSIALAKALWFPFRFDSTSRRFH